MNNIAGEYQPFNHGTTTIPICAYNSTSSSDSDWNQTSATNWRNSESRQEKCSPRGKRCASTCSREAPPLSPNACGITRLNTSRETRAENGKASSMTPRSKHGDMPKRATKEKRETTQGRQTMVGKPPPTPHNLKNPQTKTTPIPRTSKGTRDYPPPASPIARVNECSTKKERSSVCITKM
jgi:hypothetical protein